MMTSKERAALRAQANTLECVFWIGKDGITENFVNQVSDLFRKCELIKISVQTNSALSAKELSTELAAKTDSEVVQVMGRKITLYRYNEELHKEKPKQKVKPIPKKSYKKNYSSEKQNRFSQSAQRRSGRAIGYGSARSRWKNKGISD